MEIVIELTDEVCTLPLCTDLAPVECRLPTKWLSVSVGTHGICLLLAYTVLTADCWALNCRPGKKKVVTVKQHETAEQCNVPFYYQHMTGHLSILSPSGNENVARDPFP